MSIVPHKLRGRDLAGSSKTRRDLSGLCQILPLFCDVGGSHKRKCCAPETLAKEHMAMLLVKGPRQHSGAKYKRAQWHCVISGYAIDIALICEV